MTTHKPTKRLPLRCPACNESLQVSRMVCPSCETEVSGQFNLPELARLDEQERRFIIDFVKASGSLKDMAKQLGVSYPTVRNYLDDIIEKLNKIEQ